MVVRSRTASTEREAALCTHSAEAEAGGRKWSGEGLEDGERNGPEMLPHRRVKMTYRHVYCVTHNKYSTPFPMLAMHAS